MTEETKRTDITGALERAAARHEVPENTRSTVTAQLLAADAALLRSLAARITDYREAEKNVNAQRSDDDVGFDEFTLSFDKQRVAVLALLAFVRGGETSNNPKQEGTE